MTKPLPAFDINQPPAPHRNATEWLQAFRTPGTSTFRLEARDAHDIALYVQDLLDTIETMKQGVTRHG